MTKERFFKERIWPVLFMLLVTVFFISILAVVNGLTAETVRRNASLFLRRAVLQAAGLPVPEDPARLVALYEDRVSEKNETSYTVKDSEKNLLAEVRLASGPGLWGEIRMAVGFSPDGSTLTGISLVDQNETPGLGGRIAEDWFVSQFRGKRPPLTTVAEEETSRENTFQAVTGASISSEAVRLLIDRAAGAVRLSLEESP